MKKNVGHTQSPIRHTLIIGWLYPTLMSTYGDRGNIICLEKRCKWRNINIEIKYLDLGFSQEQLAGCDLLFMGGAQDRQQKIVMNDFKGKKAELLKEMVEKSIPGLYICGAYQFLGKYYKEADGPIINGLGILDLFTENPGDNFPRLIGNIVTKINDSRFKIQKKESEKNIHESYIINHNFSTLVGFENHGGRTYLGKEVKPLAEVLIGFGNNGEDKTEGTVYKNSFCTYLHGPVLPKNPHLSDHLIKLALEKKYNTKVELKEIDDKLEWQAHKFIINKLKVKL